MAELETYMTFSEAAAKYRLSAEVLTRLVNDGKIRAVRANGDVLVAERDVRNAMHEVSKKKFAHLEGVPIRAIEAAKRYEIPTGTLTRWAKSGRIKVLERGPKRLILDEASVAYARALADQLGMRKGKGVLPRGLIEPAG